MVDPNLAALAALRGATSGAGGGAGGGKNLKDVVTNAINNDPSLVKTIFTENPELLNKVLEALGGIEGAIAALASSGAGGGPAGGPPNIEITPFGPDFFPGIVKCDLCTDCLHF